MPRKIAKLVAALPERYQPIYGFGEYDAGASRTDTTRTALVLDAIAALSRSMGRPLKILDIGCAQGFISLSAAAMGHDVEGIDGLDVNVQLCRELAAEAGLSARFTHHMVGPDSVASIRSAKPDVILMMSVVHHIADSRGLDAAIRFVHEAGAVCELLVLEAAVREEPVFWSRSLPESHVAWVEPFAFRRIVYWTTTHLSSVKRPLYIASTRRVFAGGTTYEIERVIDRTFSDGVLLPQRRYFLARGGLLVKCVQAPAGNWMAKAFADELEREADNLRRVAGRIPWAPELVSAESTPDWAASVLYLRQTGTVLYELLKSGSPLDINRGYTSVLEQLAALEAEGLFHSDIRTWNVIVLPDGGFTLIDFGAVRPLDRRDALDRPGIGGVYGSERIDVFDAALALLHEILTRTTRDEIRETSSSLFYQWPAESFPEPYRAFADACGTPEVRAGGFAAAAAAFRRHVVEGVPRPVDATGLARSVARLAEDFNRLKRDSFIEIHRLRAQIDVLQRRLRNSGPPT